MSIPLDILTFLGSTVCHQLPERSYFFDGTQMPLCARCIGIHVGFLVSTLFLLTGSRRFAGGLPSVKQAALLAFIMAFFLLDAGLSYSGLSESDNLRRTVSGLALGIPFPFLLFPLLNSIIYPGKNPSFPLSRGVDWAYLAALFFVAAGAILLSESLGAVFYAVSSMGVFGVFLFFSSAFLVVFTLGLEDWHARPRTKAVASVMVASSVLVALAFLQDLLLNGV